MPRTFAPILDAARLMIGFPHPWFVSGGWAIDLFLNAVTRDHFDIEIGLYRCDQQALARHFSGWQLHKSVDKDGWIAWEAGEELKLPVFQIKAKHAERVPSEVEFFLNECNEADWISRRHEGLTRSLAEATMLSPLGLPILAPDIQLLYKAKYNRPKDQSDFEFALPRMSRSQRDWLGEMLEKYHPGQAWLHLPALGG